MLGSGLVSPPILQILKRVWVLVGVFQPWPGPALSIDPMTRDCRARQQPLIPFSYPEASTKQHFSLCVVA